MFECQSDDHDPNIEARRCLCSTLRDGVQHTYRDTKLLERPIIGFPQEVKILHRLQHPVKRNEATPDNLDTSLYCPDDRNER